MYAFLPLMSSYDSYARNWARGVRAVQTSSIRRISRGRTKDRSSAYPGARSCQDLAQPQGRQRPGRELLVQAVEGRGLAVAGQGGRQLADAFVVADQQDGPDVLCDRA